MNEIYVQKQLTIEHDDEGYKVSVSLGNPDGSYGGHRDYPKPTKATINRIEYLVRMANIIGLRSTPFFFSRSMSVIVSRHGLKKETTSC